MNQNNTLNQFFLSLLRALRVLRGKMGKMRIAATCARVLPGEIFISRIFLKNFLIFT